jgi:hypothetical protein
MKILDKIERDETLAFFWQIIGPLFILCTFALAPTYLAIFSVGVLGLFLSARFQMKGFYAALAILTIVAIGEHLFFKSQHLWLLGLEGSYAIAFLITALNADDHNFFVKNLLLQIETKNSSILNVEEEFAKSRAEGTKQQVLLQEKVDLLQKQIEEVLTEQSSFLILNEVLRKTTAQHMADHAVLQSEVLHLQSCVALSLQAQREAEEEVLRLKNESAIVQDNQMLTEEINAIRLDREQTHMINETLARLHVKENMRAQAIAEEKRQGEIQLESLVSQLEDKGKALKDVELLYQQLKIEFEEQKEMLGNVAQESKPVDLSQYVPKEALFQMEGRIEALQRIEFLHKQLREQFEEKNEILHKTRSSLFHVENALQTLQIEKERNAMNGQEIPREILSELTDLEQEISYLREENEQLQSLVTVLNLPEDLGKRKKKSK